MTSIWGFLKQSLSDALDKTTSWFNDKEDVDLQNQSFNDKSTTNTEQKLTDALKALEEKSKIIINKEKPALSYAKLLLELRIIEGIFPTETDNIKNNPQLKSYASAIYLNINNKIRILDRLAEETNKLSDLNKSLQLAASNDEQIIFLEIFIEEEESNSDSEVVIPEEDHLTLREKKRKQIDIRKWAIEIADLDEKSRNEFLSKETHEVKNAVEDILAIRATKHNKPIERNQNLCESCGRPLDFCACSR